MTFKTRPEQAKLVRLEDFASCQVWLERFKSSATKRGYVLNLQLFCRFYKATPDELLLWTDAELEKMVTDYVIYLKKTAVGMPAKPRQGTHCGNSIPNYIYRIRHFLKAHKRHRGFDWEGIYELYPEKIRTKWRAYRTEEIAAVLNVTDIRMILGVCITRATSILLLGIFMLAITMPVWTAEAQPAGRPIEIMFEASEPTKDDEFYVDRELVHVDIIFKNLLNEPIKLDAMWEMYKVMEKQFIDFANVIPIKTNPWYINSFNLLIILQSTCSQVEQLMRILCRISLEEEPPSNADYSYLKNVLYKEELLSKQEVILHARPEKIVRPFTSLSSTQKVPEW